MTGGLMLHADILQLRSDLRAPARYLGVRASWVERAAARHRDQRRRLPDDPMETPLSAAVETRQRGEQALRVGMPRGVEQRVHVRQLGNTPCVHHEHSI